MVEWGPWHWAYPSLLPLAEEHVRQGVTCSCIGVQANLKMHVSNSVKKSAVKVWIRIPSRFRLFDVLLNGVRIRGLRYHCWCWL